ncbi:DUF397 domain-containing protein [Streptomyces sp. NPDC006624]|uniref:DUF397 domain-containing protein n=1 Tax=unclassified Streptomyces TaxID=2593676 RepID=UPI0033BA1F06
MSAGPQTAPEPTWFKSSHSGANTTECVECAHVSTGALIRDSKNARGPVLSVGDEAWRCFLSAVRGL